MLKWIAEMTSPRVVRPHSLDERSEIADNDNGMMVDLIISEVEAMVMTFETEQEQRKSHECIQQHVADYSWLIQDNTQKPKKYLTMTERSKLERACERLQSDEWAKLISTWKARSKAGFSLNFDVHCILLIKKATSREQIFETFLTAVHEVILARPRPATVTDMMRRYMRSGSSVNAVSDSPRVFGSTRSLADLSFRDLNDIV
uniref:Uncharacterized protein n=1 Tax=Heterorhabditis bacteriophora TaxID=37862 RepID=A0A1I7XDU0_HETBA